MNAQYTEWSALHHDRHAEATREAFRPIAAEVLATEPERFAHVSAEGLAAVAVSFIKGCAVQAMIDPDNFNIEDYLAATNGLLGQLASPAI